jgi:hypothetical protein
MSVPPSVILVHATRDAYDPSSNLLLLDRFCVAVIILRFVSTCKPLIISMIDFEINVGLLIKVYPLWTGCLSHLQEGPGEYKAMLGNNSHCDNEDHNSIRLHIIHIPTCNLLLNKGFSLLVNAPKTAKERQT